ncbi:hypothetical protein RSOLAG1IB_04327 [Rhizoctonia solani AG-1 IB]|uniref:Uncharacterized protein n=1 Tax=Thanatephorus cucumeris (strain AG1-IB / isolate 7/3/14) TaxID=1108050 RepID=A0A0B7FY55_THACB|nr:hypothetical protein RSOLAG1IB_04327 [Rhizoctonia solani AG-1 IB]
MTSDESFTHVDAPSSIGHGPLQTSALSSFNSRVSHTQGVTYVRVGRGIVPTARYEKSVARGRSNAGELAATSVYSLDGEISPGESTKSKWYKQPFARGRNLSLQSILPKRSPSTTTSNKSSIIHQEAELPIIDIAPAPLDRGLDRGTQNEAGPSKLRKPRSRSPLPSVPASALASPIPTSHTQLNPTSTPTQHSAQRVIVQHPNTSTRASNETEEDEDGQILLDLLGVTERLSTRSPETEQAQLHSLPTSETEPETESEQRLTPTVRQLPVPPQFPVPVLNIPPPHDSQDAFAYVFGQTPRSSFMDYRSSIPPPPYAQRQSAVLDRHMRPPQNQLRPLDRKAGDLPPVAPLSIRRRDRG